MRRAAYIFVVLVVGGLLTGCPSLFRTVSQGEVESAEDLFKNAEAAFSNKEYDKAISLYEKVRSAHPEFEKIPQTYLKAAEAFYEKGDYEKAISRYLQFAELHPAHEDVPKAKYYVAMSYFQQIKAADLDNRIVHTAAEAFKALRDSPDAGEWAKKAGEKYDECMKKLAEKELDKARTYISMGKYKAAKMSAQRVLDEYGKLGYDKDAEELINGIKEK